MNVDLRLVNATMVKESWPMPYLENEVFQLAKSKCFASLDYIAGCRQLPLHHEP